ncbi:hypothetical protein H4W31_003925 [Plantactinospora soyae]|uniref:Uncharacterized protein n=1 Tax=Plantactinospora soyae TaxID=1544732 RepID=A0A927M5A7_9ACTN|nr:hypothetical protein [Plantactinospora soyae]
MTGRLLAEMGVWCSVRPVGVAKTDPVALFLF